MQFINQYNHLLLYIIIVMKIDSINIKYTNITSIHINIYVF